MSIDLRKRNRTGTRERLETAVKAASASGKRRQTAETPKNEKGSTAPKNEKGRGAKPAAKPKREDAPAKHEAAAAPKGRAQRGSAPKEKSAGAARGRSSGSALEIIPLGGLGEIGKNITAFCYGEEILLVDCGMSFPDDGMPGIDIVIPDFTFLEQHKKQVKALVITHGHEDHIGSVPYLLKQVSVPIYATRLTLGLINHKLKEQGLNGDLRHIDAGDKLKVGPFRIETIRATHSIADALSLIIETPAGTIFHTGDFKIDYTPIDGDPMDLQHLAEIGKRGVDLMLCDSTNALRAGFSRSEKILGPILDQIFREAKGRIVIATFASNVHRVQTIINTAIANKRKIALSGRSMLNVMELAEELGYLDLPKGSMVDLDNISNVPDKNLTIITTGSQGEPMSALARMASGDHRSVKIRRGDTVILSSSPIPGNEKTVSGVVNSLIGLGANVIHSDIADIHVSGHASSEEIRIMISLIQPNFYMPVHGENKHLLQNADIAESLGIPRDHILVAGNGRVVEMVKGQPRLTDRHVPADPVFVDGLGVGDIGTSVLRDRRQLSEAGLIVVSLTYDAASGYLLSGPELFSRGFVYEKRSGDILEEMRHVAEEVTDEYERTGDGDREALKSTLRGRLKGAVYERTKRSPLILPIVTEV
ncbi:MAG: ribonuclease J [Clostridiales bacterium]|nr:ribonuclease J [Clostridiales bacterium]